MFVGADRCSRRLAGAIVVRGMAQIAYIRRYRTPSPFESRTAPKYNGTTPNFGRILRLPFDPRRVVKVRGAFDVIGGEQHGIWPVWIADHSKGSVERGVG
jgi:hypothetical protein